MNSGRFDCPNRSARSFDSKARAAVVRSAVARIGVAFVPGASTFEGTVELHLPEPEQFDVETRESHAHLIELNGHARDERRAPARSHFP